MGSHSFERILIIDLGSQYTQLIARRIRELRVYSEIVPNTITPEEVMDKNTIGLILSGGPNSVYLFDSPSIDPKLLELGIPVLGICYGLQLMGKLLGARIVPAEKSEYGKTELTVIDPQSELFAGLNPDLVCWMSHGDITPEPPPGFKVTARTMNSPVAAMENPDRRLYAVQFHPEVTHTPWGVDLLRNFAYRICGARGDWQMADFATQAIGEIRERVGEGKVICGLSGGVDSLCTAALVHRAVGDQLTCIFVDHGLLRLGEADQVEQAFRENFPDINFIRINASERFLSRLSGVTDPERKRKIIGEEFINVFEEAASRVEGVEFLAQGTLYPDVIESKGIGMHAQVIKSHHNVGGLPEKMNLKLIEPLRDLFKDEVRQLALSLGLPRRLVYRHPFPGPGLAIRIIGEVTPERLELLRKADHIAMTEIEQAGYYDQVWQALVVLPAVKTVGVQGDQRTYGYPVVLRAVQSEDGMTADWAKLPAGLLERISSRIINEVPGINRVVYDISSKPPATIEWE